MSNFAKVVNGIVEKTIVAEQEYIDSLDDALSWIQTSYNTQNNQHPKNRPIRGNYAGVGYIYDKENDVFYSAKPYPSWILNTETWQWESPVPVPDMKKPYSWNEETKSWI